MQTATFLFSLFYILCRPTSPLPAPLSLIVNISSETNLLPKRTGECQSPQARDFRSLAAFKYLILNKQGTFLERFKATLCNLQLVASHKLHIIPQVQPL